MMYLNGQDQASESNEEASSYDLDMLDSSPDSRFHLEQVKSETPPIPSQSAKIQAFFLVPQTNIALLVLSWLEGNDLGWLASISEISKHKPTQLTWI